MPFRRFKFWFVLGLPLLLTIVLWRVNHWRPKPAKHLFIAQASAGNWEVGEAGRKVWIRNWRTGQTRKIALYLPRGFARSDWEIAPDGQSLSYRLSDENSEFQSDMGQRFLWHNGKNYRLGSSHWRGSTFTHDSQEIVIFDGEKLRGFEAKTGKNLWNWNLLPEFDFQDSIAFDPQTSQFLRLDYLSGGFRLEIFNWKTRRKTTRDFSPTSALNLEISPQGKWIHSIGVVGDLFRQKNLLVTMRSSRAAKFFWSHAVPADEIEARTRVLWNRDESLFAFSSDTRILLFQTQTGRLLRWLYKPPGQIQKWSFSPDDSEIWSQTNDGKFWRQRIR